MVPGEHSSVLWEMDPEVFFLSIKRMSWGRSPINLPLAGIVFNECIRGSNRALWFGVKNNREVYGRMCTNYPRTSASRGSFILVGHCGRISFSINAVPPPLWKPLIECRRTRGNAQETIKGQ